MLMTLLVVRAAVCALAQAHSTFLPSGPGAKDGVSDAELAALLQGLDDGLRQGAVAVGLGIAYTPAARSNELLEVFRTAARHGAFTHVHVRGASSAAGMDADREAGLLEVIALSAATGAPVHVAHIQSSGQASTARMLGFSGSLAELAIPENNIHFGVMYLAQAWRLAGGDLCTAVMKYRAGHGETRFSYLSVNYCVAVRARLFARGFRVTGTVPVATFGEPGRAGGGGGCGRKCLGAGGLIGRVDLVALNTRLNALVIQARGGK
jgi:hypothetical protein